MSGRLETRIESPHPEERIRDSGSECRRKFGVTWVHRGVGGGPGCRTSYDGKEVSDRDDTPTTLREREHGRLSTPSIKPVVLV